MNREESQQAIVEPARLVGLRFEKGFPKLLAHPFDWKVVNFSSYHAHQWHV